MQACLKVKLTVRGALHAFQNFCFSLYLHLEEVIKLVMLNSYSQMYSQCLSYELLLDSVTNR